MSELAILEKLDRIEKLILEGRVSGRWISVGKVLEHIGLSESTLQRGIQTGKTMFRISWLDKFLSG